MICRSKMKILLVLLLFLSILLTTNVAAAQSLYCIADKLNGRAAPNKKAKVEAYFEYGDELEVVGYSGNWVEVIGGETGTVYVSAQYVAESMEKERYRNVSGGRVIIRKEPSVDAKSCNDFVKAKKTVTISAVVDNWGYIKDRGWVCLDYFELVDNDQQSYLYCGNNSAFYYLFGR